jgi:hypothetical protein
MKYKCSGNCGCCAHKLDYLQSLLGSFVSRGLIKAAKQTESDGQNHGTKIKVKDLDLDTRKSCSNRQLVAQAEVSDNGDLWPRSPTDCRNSFLQKKARKGRFANIGLKGREGATNGEEAGSAKRRDRGVTAKWRRIVYC